MFCPDISQGNVKRGREKKQTHFLFGCKGRSVFFFLTLQRSVRLSVRKRISFGSEAGSVRVASFIPRPASLPGGYLPSLTLPKVNIALLTNLQQTLTNLQQTGSLLRFVEGLLRFVEGLLRHDITDKNIVFVTPLFLVWLSFLFVRSKVSPVRIIASCVLPPSVVLRLTRKKTP